MVNQLSNLSQGCQKTIKKNFSDRLGRIIITDSALTKYNLFEIPERFRRVMRKAGSVWASFTSFGDKQVAVM